MNKLEDAASNEEEQRAVDEFKKLNSSLQQTLGIVRELEDIASCSSLRSTWDIFIVRVQ